MQQQVNVPDRQSGKQTKRWCVYGGHGVNKYKNFQKGGRNLQSDESHLHRKVMPPDHKLKLTPWICYPCLRHHAATPVVGKIGSVSCSKVNARYRPSLLTQILQLPQDSN